MRPTSLAHLIPAGTARSRLLRNRLKSDFEASREPLLRLAAGDIAPFLELAKNDPGFPFEPDAISPSTSWSGTAVRTSRGFARG